MLVTGGTGYLGSAIVARAGRARGHEPVVFARHATAARRCPGARSTATSATRARVTAAADGVDAICHTAALVALWRPRSVGVRRRQRRRAAVRARRRARAPASRASSTPRRSSRCRRPTVRTPLTANHYQRTKVAARDVARRASGGGLAVVTLYPGVIYGPGPATEGNLVGRLMRDHLRGPAARRDRAGTHLVVRLRRRCRATRTSRR